jgi:hypothetical protein
MKHLDSKILEFVSEEISPHFSHLVNFVEELEKLNDTDAVESGILPSERLDLDISVSDIDCTNKNVGRFEKIAKDFAQNWKNALGLINASTMQSFSNFKIGTLVLNTILKRIVVQYQAFLMFWEKKFPPNARLSVQPVMIHQLVVEIKSKYKSNF